MEKVEPKLKYLNEQDAKICSAKIRCLDKLLAEHQHAVYDTDFNFVTSMKDWVDKMKRPISFKQARWIDKLYDENEDQYSLDYQKHMEA